MTQITECYHNTLHRSGITNAVWFCPACDHNVVVPNPDNYVAWCRYTHDGNEISTCDSDAKDAFKVYRAPVTGPRRRLLPKKPLFTTATGAEAAAEEIDLNLSYLEDKAQQQGNVIKELTAIISKYFDPERQRLESAVLLAAKEWHYRLKIRLQTEPEGRERLYAATDNLLRFEEEQK